MSFEAEIIADSISQQDIRLITYKLRYPRFIHAELMTHRVFSRNASSSRAIPVQRMIEDLRRDPAMPVFWGSNKPGMQAGEELTGDELAFAKAHWQSAMNYAIQHAETLMSFGLHKQIANRILEPWGHINVVVSATDYENFFTLRRHKDAQPEIKYLADLMYEARENSTPRLLLPGQWHLPFITKEDWSAARIRAKQNRITRDEPMYDELVKPLIKVSAARCARTSYLTHDGKQTTVEEDLALHDKLVVAQPLHASPAEHQATPDTKQEEGSCEHIHFTDSCDELDMPCELWNNPHLHGNLRGWIQYRKTLPGEYING